VKVGAGEGSDILVVGNEVVVVVAAVGALLGIGAVVAFDVDVEFIFVGRLVGTSDTVGGFVAGFEFDDMVGEDDASDTVGGAETGDEVIGLDTGDTVGGVDTGDEVGGVVSPVVGSGVAGLSGLPSLPYTTSRHCRS
jgi:hypothetical protein